LTLNSPTQNPKYGMMKLIFGDDSTLMMLWYGSKKKKKKKKKKTHPEIFSLHSPLNLIDKRGVPINQLFCKIGIWGRHKLSARNKISFLTFKLVSL
jgi:hypothetical protein